MHVKLTSAQSLSKLNIIPIVKYYYKISYIKIQNYLRSQANQEAKSLNILVLL